MPGKTLINGETHDWDSVKIYVNGVPFSGITEINYKDTQKKEHVYGAGTRPIGSGRGNYAASGDFTLTKADSDRFETPAKAVGKTSLDYIPFSVVVAYADKVEGPGATLDKQWSPTKMETLENVEVTDRDFSHKQDDIESYVKYTFIASNIR
jgi:hypothetical protein